MLIDVAHAYKKSKQFYKRTCKIALIFRGRPQSALLKAEGGKIQSGKCPKQLRSPGNCLSELFHYSHSNAIMLK